MNRVLMRVIAQVAVFLEFADDATLDPDTAVKQLEDLAVQVQQLAPAERSEFIRMLREVTGQWPSGREQQYLLNLPEALGIA